MPELHPEYKPGGGAKQAMSKSTGVGGMASPGNF